MAMERSNAPAASSDGDTVNSDLTEWPIGQLNNRGRSEFHCIAFQLQRVKTAERVATTETSNQLLSLERSANSICYWLQQRSLVFAEGDGNSE